MEKIVITIGRQCGSGGREFGMKLAEALGMEYYDKELVRLAAKNGNLSPEISEMTDERATNSLLYSIATGGSMRGMFNGYYEMPLNDRVFLAQAETIKQLAKEKSCVIVGRCANYVLREEEDVRTVNLYIYADLDYRIKRIKEEENLTEKQAKDRIVKTEKKRRTYYNYYSNGNWGNATEYDLCINLTDIDFDAAVEIVKGYISGIKSKG